ncbi:MAG: hypothetical protein M3511_06215, partial [Deinococcota bacterium]|nr:hypothetical protein [Deinococcota bacterium]
MAVIKASFLKSLPPLWPEDILPQIAAKLRASATKIVVLDDDPTGTQTVHDVPVYMDYSKDTLLAAFKDGGHVFYILTNSRSLPADEAVALAHELGSNLKLVSQTTGLPFVVISRSDSTLRGHYPEEVDALAGALEESFDATLIIPAFIEGKRFTVGDVHYVQEDDKLVPAGETEFAKDAAFGYQASNLRAWVEEKTKENVAASRVRSITIEDVRLHGVEHVANKLRALNGGAVCIVNAADYRDLEVLTLALLTAEEDGKRFLYRTAASMVAVRAGVARRELLLPTDFNLSAKTGGLIMVGSYVSTTTRQLERLLQESDVTGVELKVAGLLDDTLREAEIASAAKAATGLIRAGKNAVVYTSRNLIKTAHADDNLKLGRRVSRGLIETLQQIAVRPRYLLAKGGITSSDLATKGLGVKRAVVLGQLLPGVPVWRLGQESRWPQLIYVVFPGNVGDSAALRAGLRKLQPEPS